MRRREVVRFVAIALLIAALGFFAKWIRHRGTADGEGFAALLVCTLALGIGGLAYLSLAGRPTALPEDEDQRRR